MPTLTHTLMTERIVQSSGEYFASPRSFALHEETRSRAGLSLAEK